jgi:hypothetical protein
MSFIGDLVKKIPGVSDIGGFVGDLSDAYKENKDWLNPVISGGTSYLQGLSENKSRSQYADLLRDSLQRDYDSQSANQKAYLEYIGQANAARGAAASAAAAAANATDKNRRKALSKAQKKLQQGYLGAKSYLDPYAQMGTRLLPQVEATYGNALGNTNALLQYYMNPAIQEKINTPTSIYTTKAPLPKA